MVWSKALYLLQGPNCPLRLRWVMYQTPEPLMTSTIKKCHESNADMIFVQNFTSPDFQAKKITPLISPYFNSFGEKKTQKMSENGEIYSVAKKFTLLPAVTAVTNLTSA